MPLGDWTVSVVNPAGTTNTFDGQGVQTDGTANLTLTAVNPSDSTQDFGLTGDSTVTNLVSDPVFYDQNGNGVFDPATESGIPGLTVTLDIDLDGDGTPDHQMTTTTDQNGVYTFTNVPAGDHVITVLPPAGLSPTTDHNGDATPDTAAGVTIPGSGTVNPAEFGFIGTGQIGDTVYFDATGVNGQDDGTGVAPAEPGIPNVAVRLEIDFNSDGTFDHFIDTVTDADGRYAFTDLPAGDYRVTVTPRAGTVPTSDADGLATPNVSTLSLAADEGHVLRFTCTGAHAMSLRDRLVTVVEDGVGD